MTSLTYTVDQSFDSDACGVIRDGLQGHARETVAQEVKPLNVIATENAVIVGGVLGYIVKARLNIGVMWVDETKRRHGMGRELITRLEDLAKDQGCSHALVDTMAFQAPVFYQKMGYTEIARLTNVYDHDRIFLRKDFT